jgi:AraC-like DNA-binding protein
MSSGFNLNPSIPGNLLKPSVTQWDGPYFRLDSCQDVVLNQTQNFKSLFINAPDPEACWLVTLSGHGYYKKDQHRHLLHPGRVVVVRKPDQGTLLADAKGLPWNFIFLNVSGAQSLSVVDYIIHRYGNLQTLSLQGTTVQKAMGIINSIRQNVAKNPHEWSSLVFEWLNEWWIEVEKNSPPLSSALQSPDREGGGAASYSPGSIKNLAEQMGYSRAYLTRRLKEQWGETPGKVLRRSRLEEASRLLRTTNLKVGDIALKVGFSCSTSFVRSFNRIYGVSPLVYRHSNR